MVDVRVNFDYEAEQDDELTIKIGDIIKNVAMPDGGWWEGELDGKKGLFPDNFVEIIKNPDKEKDRDKEKNTADIKASHRLSTKGHVAELANKLRDGVHVGGGPPKKRESLNKKRLKAKVAFAYAPENDDELALEVGEVVEILKQEEEGWWEGALNGKTGLFPSNFVELVDENGEEPEKTDEPKKEGDFKEIRGKKIQGVGLGNIFGGGPIKLRATGAGSVKKVGPPETVERKKEEKQEMAPAREKSDSKPRRKPRHPKVKSRRQVDGDTKPRSDFHVTPIAIARGRSRPETKVASYVYFSPGYRNKREKIGDSISATARSPVRCSTPNKKGDVNVFDGSFLGKRPKQTLQELPRNDLSAELDISKIEPHAERKSRMVKRTVRSPERRSARFSTPTPSGGGNNSVFVSPPLEPDLDLTNGSLQGSPSLNTSNLTDSMILHKRRLSSPRRHGSRKESAVRATCDPSMKEAILDTSDRDDNEPLDSTVDGETEHNRSSNSLSRFKSFVKNIFTSSSSASPQGDKSNAKSSPGQTSLEHVDKKYRWTLPSLHRKISPMKRTTKSGTRTELAADVEQAHDFAATVEQTHDFAAGDPQAEQDSSSNNSKGLTDQIPGIEPTHDFIGVPYNPEQEKSPETYLASLDKYGKLPRSMQAIAGRYNLCDVLEGKHRSLHSSLGNLPIRMYYFDEGKNPYVEQHDNSDEELESCSWNNYPKTDNGQIVTGSPLRRWGYQGDFHRKSGSDEQIDEREINEVAEQAVAAVLFNLIYDAEQGQPGVRNDFDRMDDHQHQDRAQVRRPVTPEKIVAGCREEVQCSPFSEARRNFFANAAVTLPKEDPFQKFTHRFQNVQPQNTTKEPYFPRADPFEKYSQQLQQSHKEKFQLHRVHPLPSIHVPGFSQNRWMPPVVIPLPSNLDKSYSMDSTCEDRHNYSVSLMAEDSSDIMAPHNSLDIPDDQSYVESDYHNYSVSLMSSFHEENVGTVRDKRPEKYPSFMSIGSDDLDITAPIAKPDPSIESVHTLPPVICPDYQLWRQGKTWLPDPSSKDLADNSLKDEMERTALNIIRAYEKRCDLDRAFVVDVQDLSQKEMATQTMVNEESGADTQTSPQKKESSMSKTEDQPDLASAVKSEYSVDGRGSSADVSQTESVTIGVQVPEDAFLPDFDDRETSLGPPAAVSSFRSDIYFDDSFKKGFREPRMRQSSWMFSQSPSPDRFKMMTHDFSANGNALKRPLSSVYPVSSSLETREWTPHVGSSRLYTSPRIPKSEQKNRCLVIDSSTTLSSVHSMRDSLYSRESSIMDGDPQLLKGSSEKRKSRRFWRRIRHKKEVPPVQLISYKKVYEPGTAMYDVFPLLNRSLTRVDQMDFGNVENVNQNYSPLQEPFQDKHDERQLYESSESEVTAEIGVLSSDSELQGLYEEYIRQMNESLELEAGKQVRDLPLDSDYDLTKGGTLESSLTNVSYDLTLSDSDDYTENSVDMFFHSDESMDDQESKLHTVNTDLDHDETLTPRNEPSPEKTVAGAGGDASSSDDEEEEQAPKYFADMEHITVDEIASLRGWGGDLSFNALRLRVHSEDCDDVPQDEVGSPTSISSKESQSGQRDLLDPQYTYTYTLEDISADTIPSSVLDEDGSPLFSPRPSETLSARSMIESVTENINDKTIEEIVADKSLNAQQYYSLTDVRPSPSASSAEFYV